jgi:tetratricopeptide (TPR) repeat protein
MSAKIRIYEEPGVLLAVRPVDPDRPRDEQAAELLKGGLEQGRKVLALVEDLENPAASAVYPKQPPTTQPFEELTEKVQTMLGEHQVFDTIFLMDSALRGEDGDNPEVWMLAASVYEVVRMFGMAAPLLEKALGQWDGLRQAAVQVRLARARARSGNKDGVIELVREGLSNEEIPPILRVEGLLMLAMSQPKEEALETIDELLDLAEEQLGDHRLAAEALELQADLISDEDSKKAQQFYLAAGKMLLRLQDPYFFGLNERLVVHHLKHREMQTALSLSQEMFHILEQTQGPPLARIPFLVFASWVHDQMGDGNRAQQARQAALAIDADEVTRVEHNLKLTLASAVQA